MKLLFKFSLNKRRYACTVVESFVKIEMFILYDGMEGVHKMSFTSLDKDGNIIFSSTFSDKERKEISNVYNKYKNMKAFW